ncbi:MAG TPA: sigma 54-interacting transcriptional regulator [Vicinamibacterales bacterium]|nr:sigma 54-interacting transcriptional regulator [Vicinamibacterales bacterium]
MSTPSAFDRPLRLIGRSESMRALEFDLECAARSDAKVLITGETGVGKEVVARLIHERSPRVRAPLVTLNCAGLPDSLLESELFGHVRGSFTGAYKDKPGLLESASTGTVFLDEVGEMSTRMQVVLLRFLESGEIQRVGSDRPHRRVDVRLITATNRDLANHIASGAFREDLYFRLNVIRLVIPPLRQRTDDIPLLSAYYLDWYCRIHNVMVPEITTDAMTALVGYRWPGNVRELKNVIERVVLKAGGRPMTARDLPVEVIRGDAASTLARLGRLEGLEPGAASRADELAGQMLNGGESFWSAVFPAFKSRDLTRADLRRIIHLGLESTNGNYRLLVRLFNMPNEDYKRFLSFLRKHDCHLPFQRFRTAPLQEPAPAREHAGV